MAKISTKTFNPMAGVSLPGWAIDSYQASASDLSGVVDSLTDSYNKQQDREAALALESYEMNQKQTNFDETMAYNKDNAQKNRLADEEKQRSLNKYRRDTLRASELKDENDNNWREFSSKRSIIENSLKGFGIGDYDDKIAILDNISTGGNSEIRNLINVEKEGAKRDKFRVEDRAKQIGNMLPRYMDTNYIDLSGSDKDFLIESSKESLNPANAKAFQKLMINSWFPYENIDPIMEAEIDRWATQGKLIPDDDKTGALTAWQNKGLELQNEIAPKIEEKDRKVNMGDDITPDGTDVYSALYSGISYNNQEVFTDPMSIMIGPGGQASYEIEFEDGRVERVDADSIEGQFPADFNRSELIASKEKPDDRGFLQKIDDLTHKDAIDFFSNLYEEVKNPEDKYGLLETKAGKGITTFIDWTSDLYKASLNKDPRIFPDDSAPIGEDRGFLKDLEYSPAGIKVNQVATTVARFFPQMYEDFKLFTSGELDKYADQGLGTVEILKKARKDIGDKGGVYYTGVGKDSKYLTKNQLIGQGKVFGTSDDLNVDVARLPNKMINPNYIHEQVDAIANDMNKGVMAIADPETAGRNLKKSKKSLNIAQKKLLKLRKEITEVEKYRLPEVYKVSVAQIDNALNAIKEARTKEIATKRAPGIAREVEAAKKEMEIKQELLRKSNLRSKKSLEEIDRMFRQVYGETKSNIDISPTGTQFLYGLDDIIR